MPKHSIDIVWSHCNTCYYFRDHPAPAKSYLCAYLFFTTAAGDFKSCGNVLNRCKLHAWKRVDEATAIGSIVHKHPDT